MNIFLSYALEDGWWAGELADALRNNGAEVSYSHDGWRLEDTDDPLRTAIESADIVVLVLTEQHSLESPKALFEWGAVVAAKKEILPLLVLKTGERRELPFHWSGRLAIQADSPQKAAGQIIEFASRSLAAA